MAFLMAYKCKKDQAAASKRHYEENKEKIKKLSQNRLNLELKKIIFSKTGDKILINSDVKNFFYYIYPNFFEILNSKNL